MNTASATSPAPTCDWRPTSSRPHGIITAAPPTTLRSLPQRSVRAADVVDATSSSPPMPNVTADRAAVPKPKSSSSHAPNVTNSACAAAVSPSMPTTAAHPAASSRVAGVSGRDVVWWTAGSRSRRACTTPAIATTPTAPTT